MMAAGTALAIAGAGAVASGIGGLMAANGARSASQAANAQAQDWMVQVQRSKKEALDTYGSYSPTQQNGIDKALAAQSQDLQRQQSLIANIDPALLSAGKQMKQLLDGQSAPVLKNLQDQRGLQRQQLTDQLRTQLGPGGELSTAGQQALSQFDTQTSNILSSAQQQYLGEVSGLALHGNDSLSANIGNATKNLSSLADQYGQVGLNKSNIIMGAQGQMAGPQQAMIQTAGSAGQQQAMQGQMLGNLGSSVIQGAAIYGAMGNKTPADAGMKPGGIADNSYTGTGNSSADYNPAIMGAYAANQGAGPPADALASNMRAPTKVPQGVNYGTPNYGWSAASQNAIGRP